MKNISKILLTLMLITSLLFCATSCDTLFNTSGQSSDGQQVTELSIDGPFNVKIKVGEQLILTATRPTGVDGEIVWSSSKSCVSVHNGVVIGLSEGKAVVKATLGDYVDRVMVEVVGDTSDGTGDGGTTDIDIDGLVVRLPNEEDPVTTDPYVNVDKTEFYANYTPAVSYMDSYYRTLHGLMSGSIDEQDQEPTVSTYQPVKDGMFVRNTAYVYSEDGNTYYVVDAYGNTVNKIYKGGAYVTLEEVAAYVFAFGEPPANHSYSKNASPADSEWGIYLRVNHTRFSGSTTKYPYEPELPNISGCGGDLNYYEMDVGTTGTDCDPSYDVRTYNDGTSITRGAARIVYARYDLDGDGAIEINETYLFYTYNHYNDFQEYLNYEGGWGEMFGNITGGGELSDKYNCNPTSYVAVTYAQFVDAEGEPITEAVVTVVVCLPKREEI